MQLHTNGVDIVVTGILVTLLTLQVNIRLDVVTPGPTMAMAMEQAVSPLRPPLFLPSLAPPTT